jgi:hypothetical protein
MGRISKTLTHANPNLVEDDIHDPDNIWYSNFMLSFSFLGSILVLALEVRWFLLLLLPSCGKWHSKIFTHIQLQIDHHIVTHSSKTSTDDSAHRAIDLKMHVPIQELRLSIPTFRKHPN